MAFAGIPLSRSLLGVKRTWAIALHMSASDPKRTSERCPVKMVLNPSAFRHRPWRLETEGVRNDVPHIMRFAYAGIIYRKLRLRGAGGTCFLLSARNGCENIASVALA